MVPKSMKAIVSDGNGGVELKEVNVPLPASDEILVKVVAAAQNPTDWKTLFLHKKQGYVVGCDFSGIVVGIGADVSSGLRRIGERVAGFVNGGGGPIGSFSEYVVVPATLVLSMPDSMTFEVAAQIGAACYTTCQALYQTLNLPTPLNPTMVPTPILIWSGTSSVGQYAVQFAKLAGLRVISTASSKNINFVKSLGADEVFDYADPKTPARIFAATEGKLKMAVDCISEGLTPDQVTDSLSKEGGTIATLLSYESKRKNVSVVFNVTNTVHGKHLILPFELPANRGDYEYGVKFATIISQTLARYPIKHVPIKLYPHGLADVAEGLEYMRAGKVHAEKLTYRIADTPGL